MKYRNNNFKWNTGIIIYKCLNSHMSAVCLVHICPPNACEVADDCVCGWLKVYELVYFIFTHGYFGSLSLILCPVWMHTQSNTTNIIFTWVQNTNVHKKYLAWPVAMDSFATGWLWHFNASFLQSFSFVKGVNSLELIENNFTHTPYQTRHWIWLSKA